MLQGCPPATAFFLSRGYSAAEAAGTPRGGARHRSAGTAMSHCLKKAMLLHRVASFFYCLKSSSLIPHV